MSGFKSVQAATRLELTEMRGDISGLASEQATIRLELTEMHGDISSLASEQATIRLELTEMRGEVTFDQAEIRKEIAFYYSSTMKKLDDVRTELKSDITQVANVQRQHQDVLAWLNRKP
jgi:chromosome segregation ATPase